MGLGILGARRLMDHFRIESEPGKGTTVWLGKTLPKSAPPFTMHSAGQITKELARSAPQSPYAVMQRRNQELLSALQELQFRKLEADRLNFELEETNRGVVALNAELEDKAEALRTASDLKSRFLFNISHELRTPLNAITSLTQLLLDRVDGELAPEQEKQVQYIRSSSASLSELVSDLLDLAKIEAGKAVLRPREFTAEELFSALRGMFRPLQTSDRVAQVFENPASIPPFHTDEGKVVQILRNFISNALKFTEHGEVRVFARMENAGNVRFTVMDTGLGIAREDQEPIFEEFSQIEHRLQTRVKGTGLGLPLSQKLAQLLGGFTTLESKPGKGSAFSTVIPLVYQEMAEDQNEGRTEPERETSRA